VLGQDAEVFAGEGAEEEAEVVEGVFGICGL
jgi:hypothetical protein